MRQFIDLTGQRFGKLVVVKKVNKPNNFKSRGIYWLCICDCGNEKVICGNSLKGGLTKSCGCLRNQLCIDTKFKDLSGQKFGKLTAVGKAEKLKKANKSGKIFWYCNCDCGKENLIISGNNLHTGKAKSCGCLRKNSPTNKNELSGKRFGRLLVIKEIGRTKDKLVLWECLCDCGNITQVVSRNLISGNTKSCGCFHKEIISKELGVATFNALYRTYRASAKKRGLEFSLTKGEVEFLSTGRCFYCGQSPSQVVRSKFDRGDCRYNGIDRVDNSKGYVLNNVVSCCKTCNRAKMAMPKEEFLSWIERVYDHIHKDVAL